LLHKFTFQIKKWLAIGLASHIFNTDSYYLVSWIFLIKVAYLDPYLSRIGWVALKKAALSAGAN
jgi:hypothetical protein